MENHIRVAIEKNKNCRSPLASIKVGDARELDFEDNVADAVLYLAQCIIL